MPSKSKRESAASHPSARVYARAQRPRLSWGPRQFERSRERAGVGPASGVINVDASIHLAASRCCSVCSPRSRRRIARIHRRRGRPTRSSCRTIHKAQLSNGLPVWIVEMHKVPVAQVNLVVFSGTADDPAGKFGVASLTTAMLDGGCGFALGARNRRRDRSASARISRPAAASTRRPCACTFRWRA